MRRAPLFLLVALFPLAGCGTERSVTAPDLPATFSSGASASTTIQSSTVVVPPSADCAENAAAIEEALNAAQPGDVVQLTAGTYCVSEGIVVLNGFNGTLAGEGADATTILAVRRANGDPFFFDFDSDYVPGTCCTWWPTVLHFEYPIGATVRDLTIASDDPGQPGDQGDGLTHYLQYIAAWGGDFDAVFENLDLRGVPGSPELETGLHIMGGSASGVRDGKGTVRVANVEATDVHYGLVPMWWSNGTSFEVENMRTDRAFWGIWGQGLGSGFSVRGSTFNASGHSGVFLLQSNSPEITGNTFSASTFTGVYLRGVWDGLVDHNTFRDQQFQYFWNSSIFLLRWVVNTVISNNVFENLSGTTGQAIFLFGDVAPVKENEVKHNDFTESGLPGWTSYAPDGPGAIHLGLGAKENVIFKTKFSMDAGKSVCGMILDETDDGSTAAYDGANLIQGWQPCRVRASAAATTSLPDYLTLPAGPRISHY